MTNIQTLIEARDSLDETIADLKLPDDRAPQPVTIDENGTYRFRANPIVQHLLNTHQYEEMDTISNMFSEDHAALSQFSQLIGYSVSDAQELNYRNKSQIDGAQQAAELIAENEQLKTRLGHAMREHNQVSCEADILRKEVADLKAAQTPRLMSEAPKDGTEILAFEPCGHPIVVSMMIDDHEFRPDHTGERSDYTGWLPLPVDHE